MSFEFVSYIRKRQDGAVYISIPAGVKETVPINAAVKVHVDIVLKEVKRDEQE